MAEDVSLESEDEMTESEETGTTSGDLVAEGGNKKDSKKKFRLNLSRKMIIIITVSVVTLVILIAGGIFALKMMSGDSSEESAEKVGKEASKAVDFDLPVPDLENILPLKPFIIPLKDDAGDWELNVTIELEASTNRTKKEIEERMDEIRDALVPVFSKRSPNSLQNVASKIELRTELIITINHMLKKGKIRNLYFTQFVVM